MKVLRSTTPHAAQKTTPKTMPPATPLAAPKTTPKDLAKPPNAGRHLLAIDQGTTGTTVTIIHAKGHVVHKANMEHRQYFPQPGWVEHRPDEIWKNVQSLIESGLKSARIKATDVAAIGITNQRETVVAWDRRSSKTLSQAIVWQDRRTTKECERIKAEPGIEQQVREKTGLVIDPYFSASKIRWLLDNVSDLRTKAEKGELAVGTIDSFLLWRLTGGAAHKTDVSNASRTQLMNIESGQWDEDLLKLFGVPAEILPEICNSAGLFGVTKGVKVLPDGVPICGIAGDQQAALFGQTCFAVGESKCTFGTGSFLLMNTGTKRIASRAGLLTTIAWRLPNDQDFTYALEGGAFICGAAVQFLRDQLGFIKESRDIEKLAAQVKSTDGVEFVPALSGLGAPYWDPHARGLICGLTRGTQPAHIARATLEAMALQNVEILLAMQEDLGSSMSSMRVDGGASANGLLMQMQADFLGVDVVRPEVIETTSAGAAYLAGLGCGMFSSVDEIKKIWKIDRTYRSKVTASERNERLQRWKVAVKRALT